MKEPRYAQTLGGSVEAATFTDSAGQKPADRLSIVEAEVAQLREDLDELRRRFDALAL
jgi:uncharacterized protein YceH (UPF0502 family)